MNEIPLERLSLAQFTDLVRTRFEVVVEPARAVSLELTAVAGGSARPGAAPSAARATFESFSLLFEGPAGQPLGQGTYRFTHERLGAFDLFLVPISADRNARQYEVVFNRRVGGA